MSEDLQLTPCFWTKVVSTTCKKIPEVTGHLSLSHGANFPPPPKKKKPLLQMHTKQDKWEYQTETKAITLKKHKRRRQLSGQSEF